MEIILDELIKIAGAALEAEDRYLLGCSTAIGKHGGILRFNNERYYQFVILRGLCSLFDVSPEKTLVSNGPAYDLVFSSNGAPTAVVEMKCWLSPTGKPELDGIRRDCARLVTATCKSKFMVVFSGNPQGRTNEQLDWLKQELPELEGEYKMYSFPTFDDKNRKCDFWVASWQVAKTV